MGEFVVEHAQFQYLHDDVVDTHGAFFVRRTKGTGGNDSRGGEADHRVSGLVTYTERTSTTKKPGLVPEF